MPEPQKEPRKEPEPVTEPEPVIEQPEATPATPEAASTITSAAASPLFSLSGALQAEYKPEQTDAAKEAQAIQEQEHAAATSNSQSIAAQNAIESNREIIVQLIAQQRARYIPYFEVMNVKGATVAIEVPSHDIERDARRMWADIQQQIAQQIGIECKIALCVTVKEEMKIARPIRLDDRIVHFGTINPAMQRLVEKLHLVAES